MHGMITVANAEKKHLGRPAEGREDIYDYPNGLHELLLHMKNKYGNPPMYITENGEYVHYLNVLRVHIYFSKF